MNFDIITPSFNQLAFLKRCVASVADQAGSRSEQRTDDRGRRTDGPIHVLHHVQDANSTDGTREYLAGQQAGSCRPIANSDAFSYESAPDNGMYDAINRGVKLAIDGARHQALGIRQPGNHQRTTSNSRDSVIAWLNCDEQYLPGTLGKVAAFFREHPEVDILFGGMLMVDDSGQLLACRKAMPMRRLFLEASYLYNYSCAMFLRRPAWERLGGLDTAYRNAGDEELVRRAVRLGLKTAVLDDYLSAFTYGEGNLSSDASSAVAEHDRLKRSGSAVIRVFRLPINLLRLTEKWLRGGGKERGPVSYDLYAERLEARTHFEAEHPGCRWPGAAKPYLTSHRLK